MRGIGWIAIVLIVLSLVVVPYYIYQDYMIERDTEKWIERAQGAATTEEIRDYLVEAQEGIKRWGLAESHRAILFKSPTTDNALTLRTLGETIILCDKATALWNETATNTTIDLESLDNKLYLNVVEKIKDNVDNLERVNISYSWWVDHCILMPLFLPICLAVVMSILMMLVAGIMYSIDHDFNEPKWWIWMFRG